MRSMIRRVALVGALVGAFGAGAVTTSGVSYETLVTPLLESCVIVREAELRGINARTRLPQAYRQCQALGRFVIRR